MRSHTRVLESGGRATLAARGLFWLLAQMAGGRATSFVSQIILARLLSPQDFGTIGLTYTVTTIIGSLTASGIENVLLQRSRTFPLWAWPGFWINMFLGLIGAALESSQQNCRPEESNNLAASGGQEIDDLLNGVVGAVVGGFEFAGWLVSGIWAVMEAAVGERSAQPFVEEEEEQCYLNSFWREAVGVAGAVAL